MNIYDAASIAFPFKERALDPPDTSWTDAEEREYAKWQALWRDDLEHEYAESEPDRFDEFCRDKFEGSLEARADAEYDNSKECGRE